MKKSWWHEAVVYQIYPKSFCDSNGDGIGDLKGIISKLEYLSDLGVDAIWLSPFFKSPMVDNGYDVSDYRTIEPMFGSMTDMEALLRKADRLKMKILVDLVYNHTSDQHSWFQEALADPKGPYGDYYIIKRGKDGQPPNNWRSIFGGSAWQKIDGDRYYLHTFHDKQPDLNWENPKVRKELIDIANFWLEMGVYGFRMDAITFIKKGNLERELPSDGPDGLRGIHKDTLNIPGIHDFLQELKRESYGRMEAMTVAEAPGVPLDELGPYVSEEGDFNMIFDFGYIDLDLNDNGGWYPLKDWSIKNYRDLIFKSQLANQKVGWLALFNESHDQPRSIDKFFGTVALSPQDHYLRTTLLATMYMLMRGTPFIYQGQEIGMRNYAFVSIDQLDDISSKDQYKRALLAGANHEEAMDVVNRRSRDHSRLPMAWNSEKGAGYSTGEPWLPIHPDSYSLNVETQQSQLFSGLKFYKELILLRREEKDTLIYGQINPILLEYANLIAYERMSDTGEKVIIICNFAEEKLQVSLETPIKKVLLSNCFEEAKVESRTYELRPFEAVVLK